MRKLYLNRFSYVMAFLIFGALSASAQTAVTGTVTSGDDGSAIPGVNVLEKGTTNGTVTDVSGQFRINAGANAVLVFSFIGYKTQEVTVGTQTNINVTLAADVTSLSEVVVIGYGSVEAKDLTGAMASLKSENFNQGLIVSPEQLMQGKVAGVQITTTSGEPGAATNIRVRGTSSIIGGNQPLYVVDGVPLSVDDTQGLGNAGGIGQSTARNPLNFLNPSDIERIDVLKDASATAIYGSRGANGVIMITTKKGKAGAGSLEYSINMASSTISKKYDLMNRDQFLDAVDFYNGAGASSAVDRGGNTDWQKEVFRQAWTQTHNLSYGGGDKTGGYRVSTSYMDQDGIIYTSGLKRFTTRFNGNKKFVNDKLDISVGFTYSDNHDDNVPVTTNSGFEGDLVGNVLKMNPTQPVYDPTYTATGGGTSVDPAKPDFSGFWQQGNTEPNPVALLRLSKSFTNTLRALGNVGAEYEIVKGLKFKTVYGFDKSTSLRKGAFSRLLYVPQIGGPNSTDKLGRLYLRNVEQFNNLWENYINYDHNFGNVKFNGLVGYSYQSFEYATQGFDLTRFRTDDVDEMINNMASADMKSANEDPVIKSVPSAVATNSSYTKDELQSYYTRVNFGIGEKYLLTATLRADGSTKFGGNNKYGYFPSFAFKWRLSDEGFVPEFFSTLSLRLGYGQTGNQQLAHNLYTARVRFSDTSINGPADKIEGGGLEPVAFPQPDLKWESTVQTNFGLDFGLSDNKIRGTLDFYHKNTTDLLTLVKAAQPASNPFYYQNLDGNIINKGVELMLEGNPINGTGFSWYTGANVAYNDNEVTNLGLTYYNTGEINGQGLTGAYCERIADGQPLYAFYVREFTGYSASGLGQYTDNEVQKFVGKGPLPKWTLGWNNTLTFNNFDFNLFFSGQLGQYVYSNTANAFFSAGSISNGRNATTDIVSSGEGKLNSPDVSTRYLYNASFVRLQNFTLGYNLKFENSGISMLRFTFTGQNVFVITDYPFQDPEVSILKQPTLTRDVGATPNAGIDYTAYPRARTFSVGISATF